MRDNGIQGVIFGIPTAFALLAAGSELHLLYTPSDLDISALSLTLFAVLVLLALATFVRRSPALLFTLAIWSAGLAAVNWHQFKRMRAAYIEVGGSHSPTADELVSWVLPLLCLIAAVASIVLSRRRSRHAA